MAFKTTTNNTKKEDFKYEVVEELGNFGNPDKKGFQWKVRMISWNGGQPKYDIRQWGADENGEEQMRKGVSMDGDTIAALTELLVKIRDAE